MVRYQDFEPRTRESSRAYVAGAIAGGQETPRNYYEMAIADAEDRFIGRVGAALDEGVAWLWYAVDPECQGRGIAKRALTLLIPHLKSQILKIECDPRNLASCRVAEGLGFEIESEGTVEVKGQTAPSRVYVRRDDVAP